VLAVVPPPELTSNLPARQWRRHVPAACLLSAMPLTA
jgi:hypothetical protein